jgi:hypothetical protein
MRVMIIIEDAHMIVCKIESKYFFSLGWSLFSSNLALLS